jgi:hypothetical protein
MDMMYLAQQSCTRHITYKVHLLRYRRNTVSLPGNCLIATASTCLSLSPAQTVSRRRCLSFLFAQPSASLSQCDWAGSPSSSPPCADVLAQPCSVFPDRCQSKRLSSKNSNFLAPVETWAVQEPNWRGWLGWCGSQGIQPMSSLASVPPKSGLPSHVSSSRAHHHPAS